MGKTVLITGGNKGIGFGTIKSLLESAPEFTNIILACRSTELGAEALKSLESPSSVSLCKLDVESPEDIMSCAEQVSRNFGKLDVLVNNAGWAAKGPAFSHEIVLKTLGTNFFGLKALTEALIPHLTPCGHIVNIGSSCGETSYLKNPDLARRFLDPSLTIEGILALASEFTELVRLGTWTAHGWPTFAYGVSKNLVSAYTRVLDMDFRSQGLGLRVNCLHPGWVRTDMAGQEAHLSIEEGSVLPVRVIRDVSEVSGKYWRENGCFEFY
jgi:NAD(P)-dependent dehydrogenase (short-subunit alcohol dehydrogenase family)